MIVVKQVFVALLLTVGTCCATLDLQRYEEKVQAQLAAEGPGPHTDWQMYEAAVEMLAAEANKSHIVELLQTSAQSTGIDLNCLPQKSHTVPTSVHRLRPSDVKVVGAIGDSLTAANGAKANTILGLLTNYRGVAWSIGGEKDLDTYLTLPNILKKFNPDVIGFATGNGGPRSSKAKLDVAEQGAKSGGMAEQARTLIDKIKGDESIDLENDWKVVTMLIGGNDLCDYCEDKESFSAEKYVENIQAALDIFHNELPRTFVNVVSVMDIVEIARLQRTFTCDILHFFLCRCVSYASDEALEELQAVNWQYMDLTHQMIDSGRYYDREDFTVVVQPFLEETKLPKTESGDYDKSYFAPDCFHFSLKAHAAAGKALWNNMLEPLGSKKTDWHPGEPLECPTEDRPYFATVENSSPSFASANQAFFRQFTSQNDNIRPASGPSAAVVVGCLVLVCVAVGGAVFALRRRKQLKDQDILRKPLLQKSTDMASTLVLT